MQVRSRLLISVSVLDKLKDEFHVGLIGLHWDFLVDPMDATEVLRVQVDGVEPIDASGEVCIVSAVCVANTSTWGNNVDFREDRLYGLPEQLVAQGLIIKGADG